jgi:hypothetical protein
VDQPRTSNVLISRWATIGHGEARQGEGIGPEKVPLHSEHLPSSGGGAVSTRTLHTPDLSKPPASRGHKRGHYPPVTHTPTHTWPRIATYQGDCVVGDDVRQPAGSCLAGEGHGAKGPLAIQPHCPNVLGANARWGLARDGGVRGSHGAVDGNEHGGVRPGLGVHEGHAQLPRPT